MLPRSAVSPAARAGLKIPACGRSPTGTNSHRPGDLRPLAPRLLCRWREVPGSSNEQPLEGWSVGWNSAPYQRGVEPCFSGTPGPASVTFSGTRPPTKDCHCSSATSAKLACCSSVSVARAAQCEAVSGKGAHRWPATRRPRVVICLLRTARSGSQLRTMQLVSPRPMSRPGGRPTAVSCRRQCWTGFRSSGAPQGGGSRS